MHIDFLLELFRENSKKDAIIWSDAGFSYGWLSDRIDHWRTRLMEGGVPSGSVTVVEGDFSPNTIALLLALIDHGSIIVPLTAMAEEKREEILFTAQGEFSFVFDDSDDAELRALGHSARHELYDLLRQYSHPGLVLFSSGSTGKSKAVLHDLVWLLKKYKTRRLCYRTLAFLLFDHIAGLDTLLYSLSNGSCLVTVNDRSPDTVCRVIEKHFVDVLPTSPTFLNLLIFSEAYRRHNLSSLKYITYGTEVMPEATLKKCAELFPGVTIIQKYGATEVGTLRSKSKSSDSPWVKVGGEGFATRIVDGMLQVKAQSAMVGYLNAPSPFTEDGWFKTGDAVETDGDYIRIHGRQSEIINVGGEKVFPAEVENLIQGMNNVADVAVFGEKNPITGNIVCAKVRLIRQEDKRRFLARLKKYFREKTAAYKVPVKIEIVDKTFHGERFKKMRHSLAKS